MTQVATDDSAQATRLPMLRVFRDRANRRHFALAREAPDAAWDANVRWLLHSRVLDPSAPGFLLGCLLLLDGVACESDLRAAWEALPDAYRDGRSVCIEWLDLQGRRQRRHLSSATVRSHQAQKTHRPPLQIAVRELLAAWPRALSECNGERSAFTLATRLAQTQAAMVVMLSGDLAAHVIGSQPLTAVARSCLVRRDTKDALRTRAMAGGVPAPTAQADMFASEPSLDPVTLALLDAVHASPSSSGLQLVEHMIQACRLDPAALPGAQHQRAAMAAKLRALAPACEAAGAWIALLLLAALQLVNHGTRITHPLAPRTASEYVALSFGRLFSLVVHVSIEDAGQLDWRATIYEPILCDVGIADGQLGKLAAALTAIHDVLVGVLGVPPLGTRLSPALPPTKVSANFVWPHEVACALQWLQQAPAEDRLMAQACAMLAFLSAAPCRFEDALHVHMFGVRPDDGVMRIAIDPLPSAGAGKSPAARRTIDIADTRSNVVLQAWVERRRHEGAMPKDLLFGDPNDGRRSFRPGASMGILNAVLKAASGDPDVGTHELRHAYLSLAREEMGVMDQLLLDGVSAAAGHEWTTTSLAHYCHLYETPLRRQLDARLHRIAMTEWAACRLAGLRPGALRKRWQRSGDEPAAIAWQAVDSAAHGAALPDLSSGFATGVPVNPLVFSSRRVGYGKVLAALQDIAAGRSVDAVALRQAFSEAQMRMFVRAIESWNFRRSRPLRDEPIHSAVRLPWPDDWPRAGQHKWLAVRRALESSNAAAARPACEEWAAVCGRRHIEMAAPQCALAFLRWLASVGICAGQLVLCHEPDTDVDAAVDTVGALFGAPPTLRPVQPRRGRPKVYLTVSSVEPGKDCAGAANAAVSVAGLHVLMFAAWVWIRLERDHG